MSAETGLVPFLQDLVRIPSVNGRETEAAVAARVAQEAEGLGLEAERLAADPERPNVLVRWGRGERRFALIAHMDTVAEGDASGWSHPPFAAQVEAGRLYGRGAADNKAGLACGLYSLHALTRRDRLDPERFGVVLAGVVDEESGASSPLGVRYLLDQGRLRAAGAIYTYAGEGICLGHRGLLRLELSARGRAIHTGSPAWSRGEGGVNAVTGLAEALLELENLTLEAPVTPAFAHLRPRLTPGTLFHGGEYESMVPAAAEASVDVRLMPGQSPDEALAAVRAVIEDVAARRPGLQLSMETRVSLPAAAIPEDHPLVRTAQEVTAARSGEARPAVGAGPANEGYMLIEAGVPTLCGFGPLGGNAHAADEWVDVTSVCDTVEIYTDVIERYLTEGDGA